MVAQALGDLPDTYAGGGSRYPINLVSLVECTQDEKSSSQFSYNSIGWNWIYSRILTNYSLLAFYDIGWWSFMRFTEKTTYLEGAT